MVQTTSPLITLDEFLASPDGHDRYELIEGKRVAKMSPQRFHSKTQRALLHFLEDWGDSRGEVGIEWSVILTRRGQDWVPIPDLLFVSQDRLPEHLGDEPCPVPPDLAIEIISPGQSFGGMAEKATDYLTAGVLRVWVVDPQVQSITVFTPDSMPRTYRGDRILTDPAFPDLSLTAQALFVQAGLADPPPSI
ncbi:Uma2 family endonuclease [Spirulina sp. CS-785/01]|uniref:Uma2 family endonuclease n=1 Tax=Spirulina sp. CS-785/01 TaxID=3021716 RepID=UPI00232AB311|nr:Uma2 family endonuclease [Spirulina sp. CS-785/01]MDB9314482.1 Uma2 family endonuclease [Spirulina sp. CS-785/01]